MSMITCFRDLILEFSEFHGEGDLEKVTTALHTDLQNPAAVYQTALSRLPESLAACEQPDGYSALTHLREALLSDEFQASIIPRILHAFPECQRLLFVHVPKCAGTDLRELLSPRCFVLDKAMGEPLHTTKMDVFVTLHWLADTIKGEREHPPFLLSGHFALSEYAAMNVIRPLDRVFTIVREPVKRLLSHVNYIITVLKNDPAMSRLDTKYWCTCLDIESLDSMSFDGELAVRILQNPALREDLRNVLCRSLALDGGSFASAVHGIKAARVEVVLLEEYDSWLRSNWNLKTRRANSSERFVSYSCLSASLQTNIFAELVNEDLKLYEFIRRERIAEPGSSVQPALAGMGH